jgi:hypothetical protein
MPVFRLATADGGNEAARAATLTQQRVNNL